MLIDFLHARADQGLGSSRSILSLLSDVHFQIASFENRHLFLIKKGQVSRLLWAALHSFRDFAERYDWSHVNCHLAKEL